MHYVKNATGLCIACLIALSVHATPYLPADGTQVIERLPSRNDPIQQELKRMRAELAAAPDNLQLAVTLARRYIEVARSDGDPRYLGYAQASLSPWWNQPNAPVEVRVLRATLLQSTHQFPQALAELDEAIKRDRTNAQAWLTRATVLQVQGDYDAAKASCAKLYARAPQLVTVACLSSAASLSGQVEGSYKLLKTTLERNPDSEVSLQAWALTLLGEMALRQGQLSTAEEHFRRALSLSPSECYLIGAYADLLLDQGRSAEAIGLLKNSLRVDALLLRYALALKQQGSSATAEQVEILRSRFAAATLRGDTVHQREQARFELQLLEHPKEALELAQQNWEVQKEPADARIFLEAAIENRDRVAAKPVLAWLKQSRLEDRTLQRLAGRLEGGG